MRRIGLAVVLALSFLPLLDAVAQQAGKAYRVGVLASSTGANFEPSVLEASARGSRRAVGSKARNITPRRSVSRRPVHPAPRAGQRAGQTEGRCARDHGDTSDAGGKARDNDDSDVMVCRVRQQWPRAESGRARWATLRACLASQSGVEWQAARTIREILPQADRIAVLANRANPVAVRFLKVIEVGGTANADEAVMRLRSVSPQSSRAAFERGARACGALVRGTDPMFCHRAQIIQLAARHRPPTIRDVRLFPDAGD